MSRRIACGTAGIAWLLVVLACGEARAPAASKAPAASRVPAASKAPAPAPREPSVLVLTLDTTRADALAAYGGPVPTPHLDAIAAEGVRYDQAVTTAPYTGPSHASLFTGRLPFEHGLRDFLGDALPDEALTLAELLGERGYETAAFVSAYVLDPRYGLAQGFDLYRSPHKPDDQRFVEQRSDVTIDQALAWLSDRDPQRPFLLWLHLFDAHAPYRPPREFRSPVTPDAPAKSVARKRRLYHDEVRYLDSQVGRVVDALGEAGLWHDLVVVLASDHGENLGEHGRRIETHSPTLYDDTLMVPLAIRAPGRLAPGTETQQVSLVDVLPTLLDLLAIDAPVGLLGRSLLDRAGGEAPRPAYAETFYERFPRRAKPGKETRTLRWDGWKLIVRPGGAELFDLARDPDELEDVAARNPERLHEMQQRLAALRARAATAPARPLEDADEAAHRERLRVLGYLE